MTLSPQCAHGYADLVGMIEALRERGSTVRIALVLGRLGGLRRINDHHGYAAGDRAIGAFHDRLLEIAREHDLAVRMPGNSFALVIHAPLHSGHVMLAADKILRLAAQPVAVGAESVRLDAIVGCALIDELQFDAEQLVHRAEAALKRCAGSEQRAVFWDEAEGAGEAQTASHPLFDARGAIENGEFRVHYQPQYDIATDRLVGAEALIRWQGPDGLVAPNAFMNEVERARALMPLLRFVMNNCSREMARWTRRQPDLKVAINSTANDLEDSDLVEIMRDVLGIWGLDPQHLKLEITETSLMRNPEVGIATLENLRELGIRTSIDDFGTGYSSLTWLKDLPVDELKIDQSFVRRMADSKRERRIVDAMIELAHAMNLKVVAEGIESESILHLLREAGCDTGQGYFYSRPVPAREFEQLVRSGVAAHSTAATAAADAD